MKQIEATILGQSYMLACPPDGETLLREAVAIVDREMSAIRDAGRVKARERIAVLTALNLAYQLAGRADVDNDDAVAADAADGTAPTNGDGAALDALVRRIDDALSDDGLLL